MELIPLSDAAGGAGPWTVHRLWLPPDGDTLVALLGDGRVPHAVVEWDVGGGREVASHPVPLRGPFGSPWPEPVLAPDGRFLHQAGNRLLDLDTGRESILVGRTRPPGTEPRLTARQRRAWLEEFRPRPGLAPRGDAYGYHAPAFSPDGRTVYAACDSAETQPKWVDRWAVEAVTPDDPDHEPLPALFSPLVGRGPTVPADAPPVGLIDHQPDPLWTDRPTDGPLLLAACDDWLAGLTAAGDRLYRWPLGGSALVTLPTIPPLELPAAASAAMRFSGCGRVLAVAGKRVHLFDPAGPAPWLILPSGPVADLAFAPAGDLLLTAGNGGVTAWGTADGAVVGRFDFTQRFGRATAVAVAPDGLTAYAGGTAGPVVRWDL